LLAITAAVLTAIMAVTIVCGPWIGEAVHRRMRRAEPRDAGARAWHVFLRWFMPQIVFYASVAVATGLPSHTGV